MPYGKVAEDIRRKLANGEINREEAQAFESSLDEYGLCQPYKIGKVRGSLRNRRFKVIEK